MGRLHCYSYYHCLDKKWLYHHFLAMGSNPDTNFLRKHLRGIQCHAQVVVAEDIDRLVRASVVSLDMWGSMDWNHGGRYMLDFLTCYSCRQSSEAACWLPFERVL